jgi:hypothetical protein
MPKYYVNRNAQTNGDHEVHKHDCDHPPISVNRHDLGEHTNCQSAVRKAKETYSQSNGCYYCCRECHTG